MSGEEYPRVAQLRQPIGDSEWWYVVWGNGYVSTMPDRRTAILCANAGKMAKGLQGIRTYCSDTLSGRVDGPADEGWYREGFEEIAGRTHALLAELEAE